MTDWSRDKKCDICSKGFTPRSWNDRHKYHYFDCPNYRDRESGDDDPRATVYDCTGDISTR
jgi:hypothetical protein